MDTAVDTSLEAHSVQPSFIDHTLYVYISVHTKYRPKGVFPANAYIIKGIYYCNNAELLTLPESLTIPIY